jgi:NIMA (never in mitosis gene a)-related kinase
VSSKQHFGEEVVSNWFVQIALAIKHIHNLNILHRDIKSQNVFLTSQGLAKLGDFGIAKELVAESNFARTLIGTPYNMSPELCEDKPYNQKSDVWSFGCLLYEMLTLNHAFNGTSLPALIMKIVHGNYPPVPATYSEPMRALCHSMLATQPDDRPSISEVLATPMVTTCLQKIVSQRAEEQRHRLRAGGPDRQDGSRSGGRADGNGQQSDGGGAAAAAMDSPRLKLAQPVSAHT